MLTVSNLDIKFCTYTLYYAIQLSNYFPEPNTITSIIEKSTPKKENLSSLKTFGCCVCVRTPVK